MKEYTVLTLNPGSTGTKIGVMRNDKVILDLDIESVPGEYADCKTIAEQAPIREQKVLDALADAGIALEELDAVSGRAGGTFPVSGGTYAINELAYEHAITGADGTNHPCQLGIIIAYRLGQKLGIPSFFVNPMNTDELCDEARFTGVKGLYRRARAHILNQKEVAIQHSKKQGTRYEDGNYVVAHMGGAISISAHCKGKVIDSNRGGEGEGPLSPNRAGTLCADDIRQLMEQGLTMQDIWMFCIKKGGLVSLLGTDDMRKVKNELIPAGNRLAEAAYNAVEFTIVKWIAMMAGSLKGKVDAILLTGGMAKDKELVEQLTQDISWIAPVFVYPGSFENEALGSGAIRVLSGEEEAKTYSGKPVWTGFDI